MNRLFKASVLAIIALALVAPVSDAGAQRGRRGGRAPARRAAPVAVLWRNPGKVESRDFVNGPGGRENRPAPPFTFVEEDKGGSNPKVEVRDSRGRKWKVKFGAEVNAEVFATRMAWAVGYFVEPAYYVRRGVIRGVDTKLERAGKYIDSKGRFEDARFELKVDMLKKLKDEESWGWKTNPFVGSPELDGLKVIVMLTSNWDNKDVRDVDHGSNTAIFEVATRRGVEARYLITDWGGSMGQWGNYFTREKWDCTEYAKQTKDFVKGLDNGDVEFGFSGQHSGDFKQGISITDVRWLMRYLGRVTDRQIRAGLEASGATPAEVRCFAPAVRERIEQLRRVTR